MESKLGSNLATIEIKIELAFMASCRYSKIRPNKKSNERDFNTCKKGRSDKQNFVTYIISI
jgi:hypothetical protein